MFDYEKFLELISNEFNIAVDEGLALGIYDSQDMLDTHIEIERRHAARIFHMILLKQYKVKDLEGIEKAAELMDLYDCRVCVNHIAQVYMRGIMDARLERIFDGRACISEEEAKKAVEEILIIVRKETADAL